MEDAAGSAVRKASGLLPAAYSSRGEFRRGWPALAGAILGMGAGLSVFLPSSGLFILPLQAEFGWGRGLLAMTWLTAMLTALTMPLMGVLVDRHGASRFLGPGVAVFTLCYAALALMPGQPWAYMLILCVIGLVAGPATAALIFVRPLVQAFVRWRGIALALGMSGGAMVAIFALPLLQLIIDRFGWRAGYAFLAPLTAGLGLLSLWLLRRAERGGVEEFKAADSAGGASAGVTFRAATRDSRFWLIAFAMVGANLAGGALVSQLQPLLTDKGFQGSTAALIGSLYAAAVLFGRLLFGMLLDRFPAPVVGCLALSGPVVGLLLLLPPTPHLPAVAAGACLVALAQGAEGDLLAYFTSKFFGLKAFGTIFGVLSLVLGVSIAAGGVAAGLLFDHFGGYDLVLMVGSTLSAAAALALLATGWVSRGAAAPEAA